MRNSRAAAVAPLLLVAGCDGGAPREDPATALFRDGFQRPIVNAAGARIGTVSGKHSDPGLVILVAANGLQPGEHGMHLHEVGRCDPPDFASAGADWNGQGRQHGHDNPKGPHDGDFGNIEIAADGTGRTDRMIPRYHGKIPASGLALIIHAEEDDEATDPSGNSGARIACGVVLPPG